MLPYKVIWLKMLLRNLKTFKLYVKIHISEGTLIFHAKTTYTEYNEMIHSLSGLATETSRTITFEVF